MVCYASDAAVVYHSFCPTLTDKTNKPPLPPPQQLIFFISGLIMAEKALISASIQVITRIHMRLRPAAFPRVHKLMQPCS